MFLGPMAMPFYQEIGFTKLEVAQITNIYGMWMTIIGGLFAGLTLHKYGLVRNMIAGAIFVGEHNTAVLGDYAAGPSHVIPTNSAARFSSPVSIEDFLVRTSITEIKSIKNKARYNELLDNSIFLAELEGLYGHANALKLRRK